MDYINDNLKKDFMITHIGTLENQIMMVEMKIVWVSGLLQENGMMPHVIMRVHANLCVKSWLLVGFGFIWKLIVSSIFF